MDKSKNDSQEDAKALPKHIADMPERQREAMQEARNNGKFDGKDHLAKSPIGRAVASGFPLKRR